MHTSHPTFRNKSILEDLNSSESVNAREKLSLCLIKYHTTKASETVLAELKTFLILALDQQVQSASYPIPVIPSMHSIEGSVVPEQSKHFEEGNGLFPLQGTIT
jgi:hypothetical protein